MCQPSKLILFLLFSLCLTLIACRKNSELSTEVSQQAAQISAARARGFVLFKETGCFTCHKVSDKEMPKPIVAQAFQYQFDKSIISKSEYELAAAIINPQHLASRDDGSTSLGEYADILTIQQLNDLVQYIKGLEQL